MDGGDDILEVLGIELGVNRQRHEIRQMKEEK